MAVLFFSPISCPILYKIKPDTKYTDTGKSLNHIIAKTETPIVGSVIIFNRNNGISQIANS
ncbi:MAG: hypothetical protein RSC20_07030, partial [Clostridiales bacterium]